MIPEPEERKDRKGRKETFFSKSFAASAALALPSVLALVFFAFHLPYLPASLEDLDSINFALGIRHFDVAKHQPHPPGYPVFIVLAKAVHAVVPAEAAALALVSVAGGTLGVLALGVLFRRFDGGDSRPMWSVTAVAVAMTTPLYWFTAVRPLSDSSGLAAALAVQAMTLCATSARGLVIAAFSAGLAAGLRSQVVWLTVPLLIFQGLMAQGSGLKRNSGSEALSPQPLALLMALAFAIGAVLWFAPLIIVSGGPSAYWHALFDQGAEDLGNIQMLWTMHHRRDIVDALYYAFVAPWAAWPLAVAALTCVALGFVALARDRRRTLLVLAVGFGPYLVFDFLFQETFTSRYALPLIVPMAYLAVAGLRLLPWDTGLAVAMAMAMFGAHTGGTSIAAFSRARAPAFRLFDAMGEAARSPTTPPVLAMDRREWFDLRKPIRWFGAAIPPLARTLPAPPQHEWLEAVNYWNEGGRAPVWFVVDPMRASIDLVQHGEPVPFRWTVPYPVLLSGARPSEMDWYRVDRPEWYVGEGWALTPESAGVADADRRDLSHGPIDGWVDRRAAGGGMVIGGRNLGPARTRLSLVIDGAPFRDESLPPGPFLRVLPLPDSLGPADYAKLTVTADPGAHVAIEQFDASARRPILGLGDGWQEQEFNPRTGLRWRWLSERGTLQVRVPLKRVSFDRFEVPSVVLHIEGESPLTYFSHGSLLTVRSGARVLLTRLLNADFTLDLPISNTGLYGDPGIVLETDQVFSPADRSWRGSADRRHLGLRIFRCELRTTP